MKSVISNVFSVNFQCEFTAVVRVFERMSKCKEINFYESFFEFSPAIFAKHSEYEYDVP